MNPDFFFIVGRGRSGTSLLRALLNEHPEIAVAPEGQFIMMLYKKYRSARWGSRTIHSFHKDLWLEKLLADWDINREKLKQELLAVEDNATFPALCKLVYKHYALAHGKQGKILGDKNPHYALFIGVLEELFPEAKFIHIVRDYRDTILSYKNVKFDTNNTSALAYRWNCYNRAIARHARTHPDKFLLVKYEELLENPDNELDKVCRFLGVNFTPAMYEFWNNPQSNLHESLINLTRPLDKNRVNRWKEEMKKSDVRKADAICGKYARRFGYKAASKYSALVKLSVFPGILYGRLLTWLERQAFRLPLVLRARIITWYRLITGSLMRGRHI